MRPRTIEAAQGKWRGILMHFGVAEARLNGKHHPCPVCQGKDRFRFDDKDGSGSSFCSGCGAADGLGLLMKMNGWDFKEAARNVDQVIGNIEVEVKKKDRTEEEKIAVITKTLKESRKVIHGDPVWLYLESRVGVNSIPSDIRYHPGMRHSSGGIHPVMLAVMRDAHGKGVSLHRTYLDYEGNKAKVDPVKQFMPGKQLNGSAIRLGDIAETLGIGEGIETSLSASKIFQIPVWAATNAALLQIWNPPDGAKNIVIFGDNDSNGSFAGEAAAYGLAKRLTVAGFTCVVKIPEKDGNDWCDEGIKGVY